MADTHDSSRFKQYVNDLLDAKMQALITMFEEIGNQCVSEMRTAKRYKDRTGNLVSSTGYVVVYQGRVVRGGEFPSVSGPEGDGHEGSSVGGTIITKALGEVGDNDIALILVAGMNYAVYVESMGYNVMDSAKLKAKTMAKGMMAQLGFK